MKKLSEFIEQKIDLKAKKTITGGSPFPITPFTMSVIWEYPGGADTPGNTIHQVRFDSVVPSDSPCGCGGEPEIEDVA